MCQQQRFVYVDKIQGQGVSQIWVRSITKGITYEKTTISMLYD